MTEKYDLHCHSTASDGGLPPAEVVRRAHEHGVTVLALTDHDTTAGLTEARRTAAEIGLKFINGIELSARHLNQCLHIIGLNIDPQCPELQDGIRGQHSLRAERARKIAAKLEKKTQPDVYEAVRQAAAGGEITRSHFAEFLLANRFVESQQQAFDLYLGKGKPAYVATAWPELAEVVGWIKQAGGVAVVAHPLRYKLSAKWMHRMLALFKDLGGQGIEVVTGRAGEEEIRLAKEFAEKHQLHASAGSDFHNPDNQWVELGRLAAMPVGVRPVWELFG